MATGNSGERLTGKGLPAHPGQVVDASLRRAAAHGEGEETHGVRTPMGTMALVLIYAVATVLMWLYMYFGMLRSGGFLGSG